jgi:polyhydroxyalkanoate synthesis regulator phasin
MPAHKTLGAGLMPDDRLDELKRRLAASERMGSGYKDRIEALKRQISKLEENGNASGS